VIIKHGDLQFVASSHQKHRFTLPVKTPVHALKQSSRHGNQSLLINYTVYSVLWRNKMDIRSRVDLR